MFRRLFNVKASLFVFVIAAFAMAALACGSQPAAPAPAPAQPAIDPAELSKLVQDAVKQSVPEQSAAPAPVSAQEIQSMVEAAVSAGAPEGASAEEISAMVRQAVTAAAQPAAQPGASKADIEDIVAKAVADAATSGTSTLSANEVQMIVSEAIKSIPTAAPLVEKIEVVATPKAQGFLTRAPEPFPQRGGTMRTAFGVTMQHFDAHQGAGTHVLGHLYDGLVYEDYPGRTQNRNPLAGYGLGHIRRRADLHVHDT